MSSSFAFCIYEPALRQLAHRALLEGWSSQMWTRFTGVLVWKSQNPWGGLCGQLYDWRLAQTGGFYGACCACEALHVQMNLATKQAGRLLNIGRASGSLTPQHHSQTLLGSCSNAFTWFLTWVRQLNNL